MCGLSRNTLDNVPGSLDRFGQRGTLARWQDAMHKVAFDASSMRRRFPYFFELERVGLNLSLASFPGSGELIADHPIGRVA